MAKRKKKQEKQPEKQKVVLYRAILHTDGFTVDEKEAEDVKRALEAQIVLAQAEQERKLDKWA